MEKPGRHFEIMTDVYVEGRWYLVDPTDQNGVDVSNVFWRGTPARVAAPIRLGHSDAVPRGKPIDYTVVSGDYMPVVHPRVVEIFERLAPRDVEFVPATVDGFPDPYFIVNVLTVRRCVDEAACGRVAKYTEEDRKLFADRIGEYRSVRGLKIDKTQVQDAKVFLVWGWYALIVAEEIKDAFEAAHVTGAKFVEV